MMPFSKTCASNRGRSARQLQAGEFETSGSAVSDRSWASDGWPLPSATRDRRTRDDTAVLDDYCRSPWDASMAVRKTAWCL